MVELLVQSSLLGGGEPGFDHEFGGSRRIELAGGAWIEHCPGWVRGHDALFDALRFGMSWHAHERPMYDRIVAVPRLTAGCPDDGDPHPLLWELAKALRTRYSGPLQHVAMALYRGGADSVAWHGDRVGRHRSRALVATVSLGAPRKFLLRPARSMIDSAGPRRSLSFSLGHGDLVVMGGTCQRTWEHSVPKTVRPVGPRIALTFRDQYEPPV